MTDDEKLRYEHQKMHDKHKGHEQMHVEMLLILVVTLIVAQFCLVYWKKKHYKSYLVRFVKSFIYSSLNLIPTFFIA